MSATETDAATVHFTNLIVRDCEETAEASVAKEFSKKIRAVGICKYFLDNA